MRKYFLHLGSILTLKIIAVIIMGHYLFPKEYRIKINTDVIQHKLLG